MTGAAVAHPAPSQTTPLDEALLRALEGNDWAGVIALVNRGANPSLRTKLGGRPALHLAAATGKTEVCRALALAGADLEAHSGNLGTETALHVAVYNNHLETSRLLLELGADVHARIASGGTALHYAARDFDVKMVELLIASGANVNASGPRVGAPLFGASSVLASHEVQGSAAICKMLVAAGADPNCSTVAGATPLHELTYISSGREAAHDIALVLLDLGANPCFLPPGAPVTARSALHTAAAAGHIRFVRTFAEHGADLETRTADGQTIDNLNDDPYIREALRSMRTEFAVARSLHSADLAAGRRNPTFSPL